MLTIKFFDHETDSDVDLPARYEVCPCCDGHGTQCKLGAMTADQYHEACDGDPDFPEHYKSGMYDRQCSACKGKRVVAVVDEDQCPKDLLERYEAHLQQEAEDRATERMEYLYCGGWREEGWY